jgi:phosphatidylethanolamine-binding protein (PEBP) family uncharacterized protein
MVMEYRALRRYSYRYFLKLYALDTYINLNAGATNSEVLDAIRGGVLTEEKLTGLYRG